jgi:4-hydroxy-tetrahydrodipicolinate reductase
MALKGISKHVLSGFFPPTIEEHHHQHKRDSPSGTALTLAQELKEHFSIEPPVISSRREGDIVGFHEILWKSEFETLRLSHEATDRRVFASGALSCASQIVHRRESFRKLRHILTLDEIFAPTTDFVD